MKQKTFILLFALLSVLMVSAKITENEAREKALQFMLSKKGESSARSAQRFVGVGGTGASLTVAEAQEAFYVFNIDSVGGYVIVSGDDRMPDVLGYSYSGTYKSDEIPANMRAWLEGYAEQYEYLQTHSDARGASLTTVSGDAVLPMLNCHWDQNDPYNDQCPMFNGERTVTGCVATAMAQIMYYHQWPKQNIKEIPAYTTKTRGISMPAIGISNIDWDNIIPKYVSNSTEVQRKAVSNLMILCGSAVKMDYTVEWSEAYDSDAYNAFVDYFGYDSSISSYVQRSNYSDAAWNQMIYDELKNERPVYYGGRGSTTGHAFVIDGYDKNDYFHVNWGWGGEHDDYFLLSALNGYNYDQDAIIGIKGQGSIEHKYAYAELVGNTLTFYYDNNRESHNGTMFYNLNNHEWTGDSYKETIQTVKFDSSFGEYDQMTSASWMFGNLPNLTSIQGIEYLNTENVTDMDYMFAYCKSLKSIDLSNFNTQNVTSMRYMFAYCSSLTSLDVSNFDTKNVKDIETMFSSCSNLKSIELGNFNTQNVTNMANLFSDCDGLTSIDISSFHTENVTNMSSMFSGCKNLTSLDISHFDMQKVTDMSCMFYYCHGLKSVTIGNGITSIGYLAFRDCSSLTEITIPNSVTEIGDDAIEGCTSLTSIIIPKNVESIGEYAFAGCSKLANVYCYAEKIPTTKSAVFLMSNTSNATLYVPKASLASYKATAPWSGFGTIKAIEGEGDDDTPVDDNTYIETDVTANFPTDWQGWNGATGYTSTQFAPMVTTNDGRSVQVCERYNGSSANTGTVFYRTLTGLTNGTYRIELYGAASSTKGRDTGISSDMTASDEGDETAVYLYAKTASGTVKQYIPVHWATSFSEVATAVLNGVEVTDGTVEIGMYSDKKYTNWHVVQIKGVTALVDAEELYTNVLQTAKTALSDAEYANVVGQERTTLKRVINNNSTVTEQTAEAYQTAIDALVTATGTFTGAKESYDEWAYFKNLSFPYASAEKKAVAENAAAVNPTNAADAVSKTESMIPLFRSYAESSALLEGVEGSENVTDTYILNPKAEESYSSTGWQVIWGEGYVGAITIKTAQPWTDASGSTDHRYFDGGYWGATSWDATQQQEVTLPAGRYQLTVLGRSSQGVEQTLFAGDYTVEMPQNGDTGGLFNRGWEQTSLEFELPETTTMNIGVRGVTNARQNWMSFSDFRLVRFPNSEPAQRGDVNGDGVVNGTDIQAIINLIVAGEYDENADVNEDGNVNGTDIQEVINIIVDGK